MIMKTVGPVDLGRQRSAQRTPYYKWKMVLTTLTSVIMKACEWFRSTYTKRLPLVWQVLSESLGLMEESNSAKGRDSFDIATGNTLVPFLIET
jgi:hypothetical protein